MTGYNNGLFTPATAAGFDLSVITRRKATWIDFDPHRPQPLDGPAEFYPFIPAPRAIAKLGFIHAVMHAKGGRG
jgi:hypothetical protein